MAWGSGSGIAVGVAAGLGVRWALRACGAVSETDVTRAGAFGSADRARRLRVPVYLLHGSHDNVIPPSETDAAGLEQGAAEHVALVSPLIEHVEVSQTAGLEDEVALVSFMAKLL